MSNLLEVKKCKKCGCELQTGSDICEECRKKEETAREDNEEELGAGCLYGLYEIFGAFWEVVWELIKGVAFVALLIVIGLKSGVINMEQLKNIVSKTQQYNVSEQRVSTTENLEEDEYEEDEYEEDEYEEDDYEEDEYDANDGVEETTFNQSTQNYQGQEELQGTMFDYRISGVKNGYPEMIPHITYNQAYSYFFSNPKWRYFSSTENQDVVEFSGNCMYLDEEVTVYIQFILDGEYFSMGYVSIDGKKSSPLEKALLVCKPFQEYSEAVLQKPLDDQVMEEFEEMITETLYYEMYGEEY